MNQTHLPKKKRYISKRKRVTLKRLQDFRNAKIAILNHRLNALRRKKWITVIFGPKFRPNHNRIEIDVTYDCNLKCLNCNRSCRLAPSREKISLLQIEKFINESIEAKRKWENITISGGEPLLHSEIDTIIEMLLNYKMNFSPKTRLKLFTNGYGSYVKKAITRLPKKIELINTRKKDISGKNVFSSHISFNLAPVDVTDCKDEKHKYLEYSNACFITKRCGIGLTRYGYYPCVIAGGIDRIFGFDIGRKKLPNFSDPMTEECRVLCRYCGHFNSFFPSKEEVSPTWKKAYEEYRRKKPRLSLY